MGKGIYFLFLICWDRIHQVFHKSHANPTDHQSPRLHLRDPKEDQLLSHPGAHRAEADRAVQSQSCRGTASPS
ncbi:hypothetical protein JZ751_025756 [Albula glossodonta]|uniref:Uncharacterized protein n=1 Tax=Albula glossodonta TaxID=121402 RepID=A0A8T2NHU9_9TELE|nr:hypothetical protein JZ751_025756 [Albula glossodonta]